jgi:hypothetical protein
MEHELQVIKEVSPNFSVIQFRGMPCITNRFLADLGGYEIFHLNQQLNVMLDKGLLVENEDYFKLNPSDLKDIGDADVGNELGQLLYSGGSVILIYLGSIGIVSSHFKNNAFRHLNRKLTTYGAEFLMKEALSKGKGVSSKKHALLEEFNRLFPEEPKRDFSKVYSLEDEPYTPPEFMFINDDKIKVKKGQKITKAMLDKRREQDREYDKIRWELDSIPFHERLKVAYARRDEIKERTGFDYDHCVVYTPRDAEFDRDRAQAAEKALKKQQWLIDHSEVLLLD